MDITILTRKQLAQQFGESVLQTATRMPNSQELKLEVGGKVYVFQDDISLQHKVNIVEANGINKISIWHLGGNPLIQ